MDSLKDAKLPNVVVRGWVGMIAVPTETVVPVVGWVIIVDDVPAGLVEVVD